MADGGPAALRGRYASVEARLGGPTAAAERDAIKAEIVALYKSVEQEIATLSTMREDIKKLVERWKSIPASGGATNVPEFSGERPTLVADHIGASTFVEKGWSLISLGDHEGAEKALQKALELSPNDPQTESLLGW